MAKKTIMSKGGGIGESRIFRDANASDPYGHLRPLHMNGKPLAEMPDEFLALINYEITDEGIAARNAGKPESAARVTAGPFEKSCAARGDHLGDEALEPWEAPDPMKELVNAHVPEGFRARFLSPRLLDGRAGKRGWEIVKNDKGEPVKLANMVLGMMPEARALKRNKFYADRAAEQLQREQDSQKVEQERSARDTGGAVGPLGSNATVTGRFGVGTPDGADVPYNPQAQIGLRSVRGNSTLTE